MSNMNRRPPFRRCSPLILALVFVTSMLAADSGPCSGSRPADPLSFRNPPSACKMIAWWIWYGPAETKPEVLRELDAMHAAGLGGVLIYPEYPQHVDDPALGIKNVRFLSPAYLDVYQYAVQTAHHLGMSADVIGGSGWPYGGPSVSVDQASKAIRMQSVATPKGKLSDNDLLEPGEKLIGAFVSEPGQANPSFREVTSDLRAGTRIDSLSEPRAQVLVLLSTPTSMKVKRPAWGGEGYVLDHLSASALHQYGAAVLDKLVSDIPQGDLRSLFVDSLEAYGSDWTADFLQQFQRRRGYALEPLLPYLFVNDPSRTEGVRFDFWETVADLFADEYVRPLHQWAQGHGLELEVQAYGVPAVPQRAYANVDLPGGEQYDWKEFTESRWASSAAHFYGKKRVLAEYATWAGIPNRFTDTLDDLKLIADLQFLTGMTELSASTLPYSPPSAGIPGWQDYAGAAFGLNQTWWPFFPDLTAYVQRASFILEQGQPVSDVLLYLPVEDVEASAAPGSLHTVFRVRDHLAQAKEDEIPEFGLKNALSYQAALLSTILKSGYTFDGISGDILEQRSVINGSHVSVGDGAYAVLLLPRLRGMRLGALEKIADFVRAGGTAVAIGRLPERVYGGKEPTAENSRLRSLTEQIWGLPSESDTDHAYGRGRGIFAKDEGELARALAQGCPPDLLLSSPDAEIGFIHRRVRISVGNDDDYYFIVNTGDQSKLLHASFRINHRRPQFWDLETGSVASPAAYAFEGGRTSVDVPVGPRRSLVVYFGASRRGAPVASTNLESMTWNHSVASADVETAGTYFAQTAEGRKELTVPSLPPSLTLTGPWNLDFAPRLKVSRELTDLESWTVDPSTRYFSGTASYSATFRVPESYLGPGKLVWLDLGEVRDAARVWTNGKLAGDAWQKPFRFEISRWLRPGPNQLKIAVANLLINTLLGQPPPDYTELKAAYGDRFPYPEDWKLNPEPWPAGLLGPVRLVPGLRLKFPIPSQTGEQDADSR